MTAFHPTFAAPSNPRTCDHLKMSTPLHILGIAGSRDTAWFSIIDEE
jgi:hypothetical protein